MNFVVMVNGRFLAYLAPTRFPVVTSDVNDAIALPLVQADMLARYLRDELLMNTSLRNAPT